MPEADLSTLKPEPILHPQLANHRLKKISTKHFLSPTLQMANMELERSTATLHPTLFHGENTVTQNKSLSLKVLQCL